MFSKVLIANRGEIACRIIRTLERLGVASVAVFSEADSDSAHVRLASEAVCIGPAAAALSYLNSDAILAAAAETGAQAIHPGYGFLSENADFAEACARAGIVFIGPTPLNMRDFGLKHTARALAVEAGVPVSRGSGLLDSLEEALRAADLIGYPVMIKSTAGGGGIGMQMAATEGELIQSFESVQRMAQGHFKTGGIFLEKFIATARHVEVQIFGDGCGTVAVLGERDCSAQRRNQKVIEETPAPWLPDGMRERLHDCAKRLGERARYRSAGTCEFMVDASSDAFYFLEVNTRLQVEHCVTEEVSGVDLVEWMLRLAAGEFLPLGTYRHAPKGHAIEARIYAEDPNKNFQPSCGLLTDVAFPVDVRVDSWVERGTEVTPFYDPMIAKVIASGPTREEAIGKLMTALTSTRLEGIETNKEYVGAVLASEAFQQGGMTTTFLSGFAFRAETLDVVHAGAHTTVQDYPGRVGFWEVGVPPSGPMDHFAFRMANRLVGNLEGAAALECTITGPTIHFHRAALVSITGANMRPHLDAAPIETGISFAVAAGQVLKLHAIEGGGCRAYIAIAGGFDVPDYLGSKSTFTLGKFGGHGGRILRAGDVLRGGPRGGDTPLHVACPPLAVFTNHWDIGVFYGPHGAPDFFTDEDIATFFSTNWKVHYNSSRTGIRLIGPKPTWARKDGGEAGLHPSNIHDNAYAIGAIDFTGDMPVILAVDGPSLGGFVCPAVIVQAELWKMGQLHPGDSVRFVKWAPSQAVAMERWQDDYLATGIQTPAPDLSTDCPCASPILHVLPAEGDNPQVVYRQAGDRSLLVEYGPLVLDISLRFCAHALMDWLQRHPLPGILDLTPGIRSLQVHFDGRILAREELLRILIAAEKELPALDEIEVPSRVVHLPLSWDDPSTQLAIEKYTQSVRKDAPWCPSNIEFIRRINGLESTQDVRDVLFSASYLVLGLGDVYLGAPVATPLDPRHRLVTTKYNPARTWTPENAVGIGGAYLCVYGMEGPGGYQFVGRTVQMWNRWHQTPDFPRPWLLRHFDQLRFYPVSHAELDQLRADFPQGKIRLRVTEETFRLGDYRKFLASIVEESAAFKTTQQAAFDQERDRWTLADTTVEPEFSNEIIEEADLPPGGISVDSHVAANVWKVVAEAGSQVAEGDTLIILEAMKMEMAIPSPMTGIVHSILCVEGQMVTPSQRLVVLMS